MNKRLHTSFFNIYKKFNPLLFLMSLGAGGIAIIPFVFLQYTMDHGLGLITISDINHGSLLLSGELFFRFLEFLMILFSLLHLVLTLLLIRGLYKFVKSDQYNRFMNAPLSNAGILAPFISFIMTMNIFIGPVRFFIPLFADNIQVMMFPALIAWIIIWILLIRMEVKILTISFNRSFDVGKISFGWLLHPFALGMLTVTGTGIAAMAKDAAVAHMAAFMSLVSGTMGVFLLAVKLIAIFKSHFAAKGLPGRQFLPSFFIVIPNITLFAISAFRLGHYLEAHHGMHLGAFFLIVTTVSFAFETWYFIFGLALLKDYFSNYFFKKEFFVSQWGLICPVVSYAVLGSFVFATFVRSTILYVTILVVGMISIFLFFLLLSRQCNCACILGKYAQRRISGMRCNH